MLRNVKIYSEERSLAHSNLYTVVPGVATSYPNCSGFQAAAAAVIRVAAVASNLKNSQIKTKSTPLEPPCLKPL
jgi:hypothetical protein